MNEACRSVGLEIRILSHKAGTTTMSSTLRILLFCCLALSPLSAQQVIVQDISQLTYPQLRARVYACDSSGSLVSLHPTRDRLVFDNLTRQTLGQISCEPQPQAKEMSAVMLLDGSKTRLLPLYRQGIKAWMRYSGATSELALVEYGYRPYLLRDFSTRRDTIDVASGRLLPLAGNNVQRALSDSLCGAISIVRTAAMSHVILLVCTANSSVQSDSLIALCRATSSSLYVLCIGCTADSTLRRVAQRSGGLVVDNCPEERVVVSFAALAQIAAGALPCRIDWTTDTTICTGQRLARFDIRTIGILAEMPYSLNDTLRRHLRLDPQVIEMGNVPSGTSKDTSFLLSALGAPISIHRISSDNPEFEITTSATGVRIPRNFSFRINVRYNAPDEYRRYTHIEVINDACDTVDCYVVANTLSNPAFSPLFESFVNNERVYGGSRQLIQWIGLPPTDSIVIEFSSDGGDHWNNVSQNATGLRHLWRVPDVVSSRCVLRAATRDQSLFHYSGIFSILRSDLQGDTINCGTVRVGRVSNAISSRALCNTSTTLLRIDSVLADNELMDFASISKRQLAPGDCTELEVRIRPQAQGTFRDTLSVFSNHGVIRVPVVADARVSALGTPDYINVGAVPIGITLDTLVDRAACIVNVNVVRINSATQDFPDVDHFHLPAQELGGTLSTDNPCKTIRFQYFCTQVIRFCSRVIIHTNDGDYETVLFGKGMCAAPEPHYGIIVPDSVLVAIGSKVDVPIRYSPAPYAYRQMKRPYRINVHFDNSILLPVAPTPLGTVNGTQRYLSLDAIGFERGDTLITLHFEAAMGRVDQTIIQLDSLSWQDECPYKTTVLSGRVFLTNVCRAGGLRQFVVEDSLLFRTIQPNPAHDQAEIHFSLREKGMHSMHLIDMFGRQVREIFNQELDSGEYRCVVDLHDIVAGDYYAVLATPTGRISTLVGVVR